MPTNELFIVEYPDGEIDDSADMGGFTVFLDRPSAVEALDYSEEEDGAAVVRFVRDTERDALAAQNAALREDAERARWCEEMKATVSYNGITQKWTVIADEPMPWRRRYFNNPDRNAAIDAARGKA